MHQFYVTTLPCVNNPGDLIRCFASLNRGECIVKHRLLQCGGHVVKHDHLPQLGFEFHGNVEVAIAESVKKTSKVIVAHEDMQSWGYGAEIAARIGEELFDWLDAPVRRVAGMDTFVAYQPLLEDVILPQPEDLYRAMLEMAKY